MWSPAVMNERWPLKARVFIDFPLFPLLLPIEKQKKKNCVVICYIIRFMLRGMTDICIHVSVGYLSMISQR